MSITTRIEHIKRNGYNLDFSETFNHAFEIYKKIAVSAGLILIILVVVLIAVVMGVAITFYGMADLTNNLAGMQLKNFSLVYQFIYVIAMGIFGGIFAPFTAGIIKMAYLGDTNQSLSVGTAFDYYGTSYFKELFTAGFILGILSATIGLVFEQLGLGLQLVGVLLNIVISFLTFLTIPLIIFGNLKAIEALTGSMIVVSKNPLIIIGLLIVGILATLVGFIAFCVGYFFTLPLLYALYYSIYKHSVGINVVNEIDEIGRTEI